MVERPELKFGKHPAIVKPTDFKLAELLRADLPGLPLNPFGYGTHHSDWGILGNNKYGDCYWAGRAHETMLWTWLAGHEAPFNTACVLGDYAETGFDPATGANDNGTNCQQGYSYSLKHGISDANGKIHKIDGYAAISAGDAALAKRCIFAFGVVGIGIAVPESAMEAFYSGDVWDDVGDTNIVGYHYIPGVGSPSPTSSLTFLTWGERRVMSDRFLKRYCDELWVPLSREQLRASGYNSRHINWTRLQQMHDAL